MQPDPHRARLGLLQALVAILLVGCVPFTEGSWRFSITRAVYSGINSEESAAAVQEKFADSGGGSYAELGVLGLILVWPLLLDVVLLPVTWPHDILTR